MKATLFTKLHHLVTISTSISCCTLFNMTPPGYCLGHMAVKQHRRWNLNSDNYITRASMYPLSLIETTKLTWPGMCADRSREWQGLHLSHKLVQNPSWSKNQTILLEELDSIYMRQGPYRELEFYQWFANVVVATTTLQNFTYASFWSLPPKITTTHLT